VNVFFNLIKEVLLGRPVDSYKCRAINKEIPSIHDLFFFYLNNRMRACLLVLCLFSDVDYAWNEQFEVNCASFGPIVIARSDERLWSFGGIIFLRRKLVIWRKSCSGTTLFSTWIDQGMNLGHTCEKLLCCNSIMYQ
jgi:hypothetical protein